MNNKQDKCDEHDYKLDDLYEDFYEDIHRDNNINFNDIKFLYELRHYINIY
jgi:hypothetical protein